MGRFLIFIMTLFLLLWMSALVMSELEVVTSYSQTIRARTEYHGLVFQCVAGVSGGGPEVESENATLMVQGTVELWLV